jgi:D-glycero-alpha-D-manno-heptose 1-phosphate guanylyltransferase
MRAIVLAGGLGTRLRSVVSDVPKPMAPVAGRPFVARLIDYWLAQGVTELVLSVGYLHEKVQAYFGSEYRGAPVRWCVEATPLGTGGALAAAWDTTPRDETVLVLNGDTFFEVTLAMLQQTRAAAAADGVVAVFEAPPDRRYAGLATDPAGRITGIGEVAPGQPARMNAGAYLLTRAFFAAAPPGRPMSLEAQWFPAALAAGVSLHACRGGGRFIDIGVPEDYARAAAVLGIHGESA